MGKCYCVRSVLIKDPNTGASRWDKDRSAHEPEACNPTAPEDFRLTTSFRGMIKPGAEYPKSPDQIDDFLDGLPLRLHVDRLRSSVNAFGWSQAQGVLASNSIELVVRLGLLDHMRSETIHALVTYPAQLRLVKMRLMISREGKLEIQDGGDGSMKPPVYPFNFDSNPFLSHGLADAPHAKATVAHASIEPSLFTERKSSHRPMYDEVHDYMIKDAIPPTTAEVLLYNSSKEIMEALVSTVYFQQGDVWITPAQSCGGNAGTTRKWALEQGWCKEGTISLSEVNEMHGQIVWLSNAVRGFWPAELCLDQEEWKAHLRASRLEA